MRTALFTALALTACNGDEPTEPTAPVVDCENDETTVALQSVQSPDWPDGLQDAIDRYRALEGRYTAEACGEPIRVTIRPNEVVDTSVEIVTEPLPADNTCGCTFDPAFPADGALDIIARTTVDITVLDYPEEGFREENAGSLVDVPVAIYSDGSALTMRACTTELVPPVLLLDYRDVEFTFRVEGGNLSGNVSLVGPDIPDATCTLSNFVRTGAAD
jgi:hypothetical protein